MKKETLSTCTKTLQYLGNTATHALKLQVFDIKLIVSVPVPLAAGYYFTSCHAVGGLCVCPCALQYGRI